MRLNHFHSKQRLWLLCGGIILSLSLALGSPLLPAGANPGVEVAIINAPAEVDANSDFVAKVAITQGTVTDLDVAQFDITYDKAVLHVTSVVGGEIGGKAAQLGTWGYIPAGTEDTGRIRVICNQPMPTPENTDPWPDGYGYLVELHFDVAGNAGSSTTISFPEAGTVVLGDKNANPIPVDEWVNSGTVYVAGSATLEGHVTFSGRGTPPNSTWAELFNVTLFEAGNLSNVLWTGNAITNNTGVFTVSGLAPGMYDVSIKNWTCLSELVTNQTLTAGNTTVVDFGTTREGDIDNNDWIYLGDLLAFSTAWNTKPGDGLWNADADLDRNDWVYFGDLSLFCTNWDQKGEAYGHF